MMSYASIVKDKKGAGFKPAPFFVACALLSVMALPASAEVPVVEIESSATVTPVKATSSATTPTPSASTTVPGGSRQNQLSEVFMQMQQLQQEVQALRGLVEQQAFDIQSLQQQGKDNYIDLDKRISALQSAPVSATGAAADTATKSPVEALPAGAEKDSYDAAYKLLDQGRKDDAVVAFQKHVALYPTGKYTPNAYYWTGQIYLSQSQLDLAQEQFATLLKNFPDDRKAPDAKFALGKVYFQQGKKSEAKKLIQEVSQGDSKAAALAKTFLQDNF